MRQAWDPLLPGRCHNSAAGYVSGTVNLISDIAVLLLPVVGVARLRMETRKKAAVSAVFATGLVYVTRLAFSPTLSLCMHHADSAPSASAISAVRLFFSSREAQSSDKSYWLALVGLCGTAEICMVILCGCFTSFPRFLKWVKGDRGSSSRGYHQGGYRSRGYDDGSESRSRLKGVDTVNTMTLEMGKIEVTSEIRMVEEGREEWRVLR